MNIKGLTDEDFVNYRKPSMFIACPKCSFKCDKENGCQLCQNMPLASVPDILIDNKAIINRYVNNPITSAVVFGGLEPFDTFEDLRGFIKAFREDQGCMDDIVIYTGYTENEVMDKILALQQYPNIIIKFGRFRPNQKPHYDEVIGIDLASDNQFAKKIS